MPARTSSSSALDTVDPLPLLALAIVCASITQNTRDEAREQKHGAGRYPFGLSLPMPATKCRAEAGTREEIAMCRSVAKAVRQRAPNARAAP
jgi:hypothetical protein